MSFQTETVIDGKGYTLETGRVAKQANGSVLIRCGDTMILVTACVSEKPSEVDFLPLTVDIDEKMYAAGKIPGSFFKREGRPGERSILTARLIDRPLRPSFPKGFRNEVHVMATILSVDLVNPPDVLAMVGASAALTISDIPFNGPIAGVRVGRLGDRWIINPTYEELETSKLDLIVAGNREAILMVEAGANEVSEAETIEALEQGHKAIKELIDWQEGFRKEVGSPKEEPVLFSAEAETEQKVREHAAERLRAALKNPDKETREEALTALEEETMDRLASTLEGKEKYISAVLSKIKQEELRRMIVEDGVRSDGRGVSEIRPISCEVEVLPRTHGSGLFTRGQTQLISIITLGTVGEEQRIDSIGVEESKRFLHHYNFPPFCTGEVGFLRGPRRREIGHGALVERAISYVLPDEESFPYTIRVVSEVLESNGSTSMASVCASSLGLMDAGVPLSSPVAGIAMGLIKEGDQVAILTDILGLEDALGDMDFKVAGTAKGITALQMDMKIAGVNREILAQALEEARKARLFILDKITETIPTARENVSEFAPRIVTIKINPEKIGSVIGPRGKMIRSIIEETGASIDIEDDGTVFIASREEAGRKKAQEIIEQLTREAKVGDQFTGTVNKTTSFGAFVEILPGQDGLVHISRLAERRIRTPEEVVKVGDKILVEVLDVDRQGKISLGRPDIKRTDSGRSDSAKASRPGYQKRDR